ncbi:cation:H+ antiporter [Salibacterium qingdaonense]|uniref:Cation:H+ antiporter n=1 Tax=Salibacterium qingdaonense TaxID=266892 RepID=A0A1I4NSS0_9BACI|nr:cation:H+ antiporter [Salibacterium qingdaonense]
MSTYANQISQHTKIGGLVAGTMLLAAATSLPELTATVSAGIIGNADIAVGNGLGSIIFNIFFLFLLDVHFRRHRLFLNVSDHHLYTGIIGLLLCAITCGGMILHLPLSLLWISLISVLVTAVYAAGMWYISQKQTITQGSSAASSSVETIYVPRTVQKFIFFAAVIFVSGSALSVSGDIMADTTGISATAVGSILVATATSIPDAVSVYVALRLANVNLAVGTILGSNAFNVLMTAIGDLFYTKGSIWNDTSNQTIIIAAAGFVLTGLVMAIIKRDHTRNTLTYIVPSLIIVTSYIVIITSILFYNENS